MFVTPSLAFWIAEGLGQECVKPLIQAAEGSKTQLQSVSEAKALPVAEVPQVQKPNLIKSKQSGSDPKASSQLVDVYIL